MTDDALESLLRESNGPAEQLPTMPDDLAERVRLRWNAVQRRRQRVKRFVAFLGCYIAGMLSMWAWTSVVSSENGSDHRNDLSREHVGQRAAVPGPVDSATGKPVGPQKNRPGRLIGDMKIPSPYQRLRRLGDEYLLNEGNVELAVEFYARALDAASKDELQIAYEEDTWMLITLKKDRLAPTL